MTRLSIAVTARLVQDAGDLCRTQHGAERRHNGQGFNHHGMKLPWQVTPRAKNSPQPTFQLDNSEGPGQSFIYWEKMR